jgi:hypothetical protein
MNWGTRSSSGVGGGYGGAQLYERIAAGTVVLFMLLSVATSPVAAAATADERATGQPSADDEQVTQQASASSPVGVNLTALFRQGSSSVEIDNGQLSVEVGALGSGSDVNSNEWQFDGVGTLYRETYGFRDGTGPHVNAEQDGTVVSPYPASVSPGSSAEATVEIPVQTSDGTTVDLQVIRRVTLAPNEPTLRVEYEVTNPADSGASFEDLRLSQYVDYDIGSFSDDAGEYFFDSSRQCEFIFQESSDEGLFSGFTAESLSTNHDLRAFGTGPSGGQGNFRSGDPDFNDDDKFPDSGTADVTLAFEWSLGSLAPGETTTFRNSFVYNQNEDEFETELCQESPGGGTPAEPESDDDTPPEIQLFDASADEDAGTIDVRVEANERLGGADVILEDEDGNRIGRSRLTDALGPDNEYDTSFDLPDDASGEYTAYLHEADDLSSNQVRNPEQYNDTVAFGVESTLAGNESTNDTTANETDTPTPTPEDVATATPTVSTPSTTVPTTAADDDADTDGDTDGDESGIDDGDTAPAGTTTTMTTAPTDTETESETDAETKPGTTVQPARDPGDSGASNSGSLLLVLLALVAILAVVAVIVRFND